MICPPTTHIIALNDQMKCIIFLIAAQCSADGIRPFTHFHCINSCWRAICAVTAEAAWIRIHSF